jgi:hypothetical protein
MMSSLRRATLLTFLILLLAGCTTIVISGCAADIKKESGGEAGATSSTPDLGQEYSLQSDRSALDELRKDIPEEVKKQNDEVALIMSYIVRDSEEDPNRLRDRFNTALRKRREANDKALTRARESFSKNEKKSRESFMAKSKQDREEFLNARKRSAEDRKSFFNDQDDRRKSFFAESQEKRKDFEASVMERRKAVEDSTREKQNAFNQEWRAYQARYTERKKQADLKKKMETKSRDLERAGKPVMPVSGTGTEVLTYSGPAATSSPTNAAPPKDPLAEFDQIPKGPGVQLMPGKKGP